MRLVEGLESMNFFDLAKFPSFKVAFEGATIMRKKPSQKLSLSTDYTFHRLNYGCPFLLSVMGDSSIWRH